MITGKIGLLKIIVFFLLAIFAACGIIVYKGSNFNGNRCFEHVY